jgi:hypothetical protein
MDKRKEYSEKQKVEYVKMYKELREKKLKKDQKNFMQKAIDNYYTLTPKRQDILFVALKRNRKDMEKLDHLIEVLKATLAVDNYELSIEEQQDLGYFTQNNVIEYLGSLQAPVLYR